MVLPGERVSMPREADVIIGPDNVRHNVRGGDTFNAATDPGVYKVVAAGKIMGAFVVNPAHVESDLQYADGKRVERVLGGANVKRVDDASGWVRNIYGSRVGREVWRAVLLMLLALLVIEAIAAATGSGPATRSIPEKTAEA
jgi:hypothetical protein